MASTNKTRKGSFTEKTAEGAPAARMTPIQALRRSVMSCLLWEGEFYESGQTIAERISSLSEQVSPQDLAAIAIEAREVGKLRHVPLLLLVTLCKRGSGAPDSLVSKTIERVIQRADELSELLALYWKINGADASLSKQLKLGLAAAFAKFDAYQIGKYDRSNDVRLRDVLFLSHAKPTDAAREALYKELVAGELAAPDTWEVALSAGGDKKAEFTRLLETGKLGYMALLRNLRNMTQAGVDEALIRGALVARKGADRVLPFRFLTAAKYAPRYEDALQEALLAVTAAGPKLKGKTVVLVDTSGSMGAKLSGKSELTRLDASIALTAVLREQCEQAVIYATAGNDSLRTAKQAMIPSSRRGFGLIAALQYSEISRQVGGGGIFLSQAMAWVQAREPDADRIVVITDEQDTSRDNPRKVKPYTEKAYMINVASAKNGIGYSNWVHIDGFSESAVRYMLELEAAGLDALGDNAG